MKQEVNTQEERHGKGQSDFLLQGGILALASFVVRLIGMIYRIPMVNIIGSEGNGYYSNDIYTHIFIWIKNFIRYRSIYNNTFRR